MLLAVRVEEVVRYCLRSPIAGANVWQRFVQYTFDAANRSRAILVVAALMIIVSGQRVVAQSASPGLTVRAVRLSPPPSARGEAVEPSIAIGYDTPQHIVVGGYS